MCECVVDLCVCECVSACIIGSMAMVVTFSRIPLHIILVVIFFCICCCCCFRFIAPVCLFINI